MRFKRGSMVVLAWFLFVGRGFGADGNAPESGFTDAEKKQLAQIRDSRFCQHIIAVDNYGNAVLPIVGLDDNAPEGRRYHVRTEKLAGEDTAEADFVADLAKARTPDDVNRILVQEGSIRNAMQGRRMLYLYLDEMFKAIEADKPDEVVVHIHGGMNNINGAIEKTARISDELHDHPEPGHRIFYIGICWNSDLRPTYLEHLYPVREGLWQPGKAIVTLPAMLLSDIGSAAARLPLDLINFLYQDAYTVNRSGFKRARLAVTRVDQLLHRQSENAPGGSLISSPAENQRTNLDKGKDFALWLLTQPSKVSTTLVIDWLGTEAWKDMLRRTRTMFERESHFIPNIDYCTAERVANARQSQPAGAAGADLLLDQMNATGRRGAVSVFCHQAQSRLIGATKRPKITLIGHSMGAIVACEILERFHQLTLDNVVFLAAACSIRDFKAKVIPFLQEQDLREKLLAGAPDNWQAKLAAALNEHGLDAAAIAEVQRRCAAPSKGPAVTKTRFFNLCLHDTAENGEKFQTLFDVPQRGSLLTWIDVLFQKPESENDRTFGRWVNSVLATDSLPSDVVNRITIKEFGRDRKAKDFYFKEADRDRKKGNFNWHQPYLYKTGTFAPGSNEDLQEPVHHGDFGRFEAGQKKDKSNFAFWGEIYRLCEDQSKFTPACAFEGGAPVAAPVRRAARGTGRKTTARARPPAVAPPPPPPPVAAPAPPAPAFAAPETTREREARTGF